MARLSRTLRFIGFTLIEYVRSGRILIELIAAAIFFYVFLQKYRVDANYFFTVNGVFGPLLTLYTMSAVIGLGDRPQGYILLVRRLSRADYLLGLYVTALAIVAGIYGLISVASALINPPSGLTLTAWLLGTLPMLLNYCLLAALMLMLSPLVFPASWRLFVLSLIALAFSSNFISGTMRDALPAVVQAILRAIQAILGGPLVPAFYGFQLAVTRDYSAPTAIINIIAQCSLLISLLIMSVYSFNRRDLVFNQ